MGTSACKMLGVGEGEVPAPSWFGLVKKVAGGHVRAGEEQPQGPTIGSRIAKTEYRF